MNILYAGALMILAYGGTLLVTGLLESSPRNIIGGSIGIFISIFVFIANYKLIKTKTK